MVKYELLSNFPVEPLSTKLKSHTMPEVVHLDDPAFAVMTDFSATPACHIGPNASMDEALTEMKHKGVRMLLVVGKNEFIQGIIDTETILGEQPIKIIQERRINRSQVLVKMLMTTLDDILAFNIEDVASARVGNIVTTMQQADEHYALVIKKNNSAPQTIRGLFSSSQISKQIHEDVANSVARAQTISELQKRHV